MLEAETKKLKREKWNKECGQHPSDKAGQKRDEAGKKPRREASTG